MGRTLVRSSWSNQSKNVAIQIVPEIKLIIGLNVSKTVNEAVLIKIFYGFVSFPSLLVFIYNYRNTLFHLFSLF